MYIFLLMLMQPLLMLFIGIGFLLLLLWFFWPKKGGMAKFFRMKRNSERVLLEDALKYMFDCEYKSQKCNMNSIAGNLNISGDKVSHLLDKLLSLGLINTQNQTVSLTDSGRSYALRIIRVHRILERYLAEKTGISQTEWHEEADHFEHNISLERTEELAQQIGNPVFDPHGDPIPTAEGKLPEPKGVPLSSMKEKEIGYIVHIEDEPKSIYEQLLVEGLYPGMQIYITDVNENKITFSANGDERILTPFFANQVTVELRENTIPVAQKHELLSSLEVGEKAEVVGLSANCRGQQRRRLMDLGIIPGGQISAVIISASGDPVGYRILGTTIGIRQKEADLIFINKNEK